MWLLLVALFGLLVPNGLFIYWLLFDFHGFGAVVQDRLALVLLSVYFANRPIGRVGWQWFVFLSLLGGLGFSLPLYYWLNRPGLKDPRGGTTGYL